MRSNSVSSEVVMGDCNKQINARARDRAAQTRLCEVVSLGQGLGHAGDPHAARHRNQHLMVCRSIASTIRPVEAFVRDGLAADARRYPRADTRSSEPTDFARSHG